MSVAAQYIPAAYSLTAVGVWGTSDFLGGVGARRVNAFLFTAIVHISGLVAVGALALMIARAISRTYQPGLVADRRSGRGHGSRLVLPFIGQRKHGTGCAGSGRSGRRDSHHRDCVLRRAFPGHRHVLGFILAGIGVWLISRTEGGAGRPEGLGMAVLAGIGFAGFYLCVHQAGNASLCGSPPVRAPASLLVTGTIVLFGRHLRAVPAPVLGIAVVAGILDITGTVVFIRASQIGRLDDAVVLSSLYPAITVLLARIFLHEHFSRARTIGMVAALAAVPMIAG